MTKRYLFLTLLLTIWGVVSAWAVEPPVSGKMYYIYCHQKNGSDQWFYYNSSNRLSVSDSYVPKSNDYLFLCTTTASDGVTTRYQFKSLKGNYYLWHGGLGSGNTFTLETGNTVSTGEEPYYSLKSTGNNKYLYVTFE